MIKVFALLPKREDITREQFHEHWSTTHREHALRITRLRRYVQAHRVEHDLEGLQMAPYEGVPEVWYDSLESALGQDFDPNYTEYAQKDEPNFVDMSGIAWVMTGSQLLRDDLPLEQDTAVAKVLLFVRRPAGVSPEAFAGAWQAGAQGALDLLPEVRRAAVATTLPETYGGDAEPAYDGILELWWPDFAVLDASWAATGPALLEHLSGHVDLASSGAVVATELRVIWPSA